MSELSVHEAIFTTRAMRHLRGDPVPRADLEYVIEAATMAPSAGNLQMWAFVVVTDADQRRRLADLHREIGRKYIRDLILADPTTSPDRRRVYGQAMHNVEHLDEAPAIVVICLTQPCPDDAGVASGFFGSIFPAAQNLLLAARSRGLGGVLITLGTDYAPFQPLENPAIGTILGLPEHVKAVAMVPLGYPKGRWGRPWRQAAAECTHWERWSSTS
jgi:nitroreductase